MSRIIEDERLDAISRVYGLGTVFHHRQTHGGGVDGYGTSIGGGIGLLTISAMLVGVECVSTAQEARTENPLYRRPTQHGAAASRTCAVVRSRTTSRSNCSRGLLCLLQWQVSWSVRGGLSPAFIYRCSHAGSFRIVGSRHLGPVSRELADVWTPQRHGVFGRVRFPIGDHFTRSDC